ncbi:MAG: hypothetical protein LUP94_03115 [Candidatus Methanomethylicus sp.]|nr:hypothetical protein [Candidatus Methanomethylicus sp.]
MVQIGFEPKIAFLCPLCNKEVGLVYEKGKDWNSEHGNCVNFSVIRSMPKFMGHHVDSPLIYINLESDFSIKETIEGLRNLAKEELEQEKKQKLESGIKRLESRLGYAEKNMTHIMDVAKSGAFGLKVVSGRGVYAMAWRSGERYWGLAESKEQLPKEATFMTATGSIEEFNKFVLYWLHYWEIASGLVQGKN